MYQRGAGQPAGPTLHFRPHGNYFACALTCARGRAGATRSPAIDRASRESHDVHARLEYRTIVLGGLSGASAWSLLLPELLPQGLLHHLLLLLLQLWSPPLL